MGNNQSSPNASGQPPRDGTRRVAHPSSPALRSPTGRRKKSIELDDPIPSSLAFSPLLQTGAGRGSAIDDDDVGTLRGAMQGKAAHVVYGPRRPAGQSIPGTPSLLSSGPSTSGTSSYMSARPVSIALPTPGRTAPAPLRQSISGKPDPDDTLHPSFKASPRLTSDVLLSSDQMPVMISPLDQPKDSPFFSPPSAPSTSGHAPTSSGSSGSIRSNTGPPTSIAEALSPLPASSLLPPTSSVTPFPPATAPSATVQAPIVPTSDLPIHHDAIPSGTSVIAHAPPASLSNPASGTSTPLSPTSPLPPAVLLPPTILNAPVAAIPIPLLAVPSATIAASLKAAAVDVGAGPEGVPTLIKWKDEDGQGVDPVTGKLVGPKEVFVTGTFAEGWKMKIELRKNTAGDFSALISLPAGPHRLKFIVDREWKASKHLQLATDADGNLINYLHVNSTPPASAFSSLRSKSPPGVGPWVMPGLVLDDVVEAGGEGELEADLDEGEWTTDIPAELLRWDEEAEAAAQAQATAESSSSPPGSPDHQNDGSTIPSGPTSVPPPMLPAQLEKGPLNHAAYVTQGSGDDNSILPKPDHSVINHLAASPIKGGFLSVGVTTRYKRKFVTIVYYKALAGRD